MKEITLTVPDFLFTFYEKVGIQAGGIPVSRPESQAEQSGPQRTPDRWGPPPPRSRLPDDPWEIPPKKDSRSGRDSRDTKTRSSTRRDSRADGMMSDRPSILNRLEGFRAQLDRGKQSVPTRNKGPKVKPKQR